MHGHSPLDIARGVVTIAGYTLAEEQLVIEGDVLCRAADGCHCRFVSPRYEPIDRLFDSRLDVRVEMHCYNNITLIVYTNKH